MNISLDYAATWQAAEYDPTDFVTGADCMIIDEVQRVPELLLAIKETVCCQGALAFTASSPANAVRPPGEPRLSISFGVPRRLGISSGQFILPIP